MARKPKIVSGQPGNALSLEGGFIKSMSSGEDVLTIQGSSAQTGDLLNIGIHTDSITSEEGEVINVTSSGETRIGKIQSVLVSSGSTAYTVLSSNSGKKHILPGVGHGLLCTLPAHDAGLNYQFYTKAACSSNGLSFETASTPGTIAYGAAINNVKVVAASVADMLGGAAFDFWSDGTLWYMSYDDTGSSASELLTVSASA